MAPPTLFTDSRSAASPSVSSTRNAPFWVSFTTRSWNTWYVVFLRRPAQGDVSTVYSDRGSGVLSHQGLWPADEAPVGCPETASFSLESTHRYVPHPSHVASFISSIVDVEWGSDRTKPVIELKCDAFLRLAADPAAVARGRMAHSLRTTGSGALNFCLVAQGAIDVCW